MALREGLLALRPAVLACLLSRAGPAWALSEPAEPDAPAPSELLGQRLLLWLVTLAGFYGLVLILDDFAGEGCPPPRGPRDAATRDWSRIPARVPCPPRRHCSMQSSLRSLRQTENDLVTLLYKLRKHKVALATGWFPSDKRSGRGMLPNDLVIYTIQDET